VATEPRRLDGRLCWMYPMVAQLGLAGDIWWCC
jgi:hypothetical protein